MICESRPRSALCWHGNPARYRVQSLGANVSTGGAHKSWFTTDVKRPRTEQESKKEKNDSQWTEKRADGEEQLALRCEEKRRERRERKEKQSADHVGDGRPSVVREPETEVLSYEDSQCHGSGENDSQSQEAPPTMDVELILRPLRPSSHRCCLDGGTIG